MSPIEKIYTADEAARLLRIPKRLTIKLGRRYGLCAIMGRCITFSASQLLALREATRAEPQERVPVVAPVRWRQPSPFESVYRAAIEKSAKRNAKKELQAEERKRREDQKANLRRLKAENAARPIPAPEQAPTEKLDLKNKDPAYWTEGRKARLKEQREERVRRRKGWPPNTERNDDG